MKFKDYKYERPDFLGISKELENIASAIKEEKEVEKIIKLIDKRNEIIGHYDTLTSICYVRNTIDTTDAFYEEEISVIQENGPMITEKAQEIIYAIINHEKKPELEKHYGKYWFEAMELSLKTFNPSVSDLLVEEGKLTVEYNKVMASAQIEYDGKINNLSQMRKYTTSVDRNIRKEATLKVDEFLQANEEKIDNIYDKLVKIRHEIALKLGYKNFIELGYARMGRTDYNASDVDNYRKQVLESLVPVANEIILKNCKRIGVTNPQMYDLDLQFLDGNPTPKGNKDELVNKALKMYTEMSKETKEFFEFMIEHDLLDLETKKGKQNGGYCTYFYDYKSPFIFSNFNGTSGDVDVLTHEAGHAFMAYTCSKELSNPDLIWPTSEACEIHSMSMEFFAHPWMELFFEEDTKKYLLSHTNEALTFIPYGVCVDHFQHLVYENPFATPQERKEMWKKCEKMYTPWRVMDEIPMYAKGAFWYKQGHIFSSPFYYIDYTLAQVCALEFYLDSLENKADAWDRYVKLCKLGGSKSFVGLIKEVGIHNPFENGSIRGIIERLLPVIEKLEF